MTTDAQPLPPLLIASARARGAVVGILACLYRALLARCPLVVAVAAEPPVPDADYRALLGFVRAALPSRWSRRCRTLWLPSDPVAVLRGQLADLVVLDHDAAALLDPADAPIQVDQDGEPLVGGEPDAQLIEYAEQVVAAALRRPALLPAFGLRFDALLGADAAPGADRVALISVVFDLAECLAPGSVGAPGVLRRHLVGLARRRPLPWGDLMCASDWAALDRDDLSALMLTPPGRLDPGERSLQAAAVAALATTGWQLADAPTPWRRPDDPAWWDRLMDLLVRAPALIPGSLLGDLGRGLSLDELPAAVLAPLLAAELHQGTLWRRRFQGAALAGAAAVSGVFPILVSGFDQGELDGGWCERLLADADERQLVRTGIEVFAALPDPGRWGRFLRGVVQRLRALPTPAAPGLADAATGAAQRLDLPRDLDLLIALLELAARVDHSSAPPDLEPLWTKLAGLTDSAAQRCLVAAMADQRCGRIRLADCADDAGRLRLPWMMAADHAGVLLADAQLVARLGPEGLLWLAGQCAGDAQQCERAYQAVDAWMRRAPERTAGALIAAGAWRSWRRRARPLETARQPLAMLWLTHPAHAPWRSTGLAGPSSPPDAPASAAGADASPPPITMETWQAVMADLVEGLTASDVRRLATRERQWPWIASGERCQIADLAGRCRDLGALAVLAQVLAAQGWSPGPGLGRGLLAASRFAGQVSADDFAWLRAGDDLVPAGDSADLIAPTLAASWVLCAHGGERLAFALRARMAAVLAALDATPAAALAAADSPPLWSMTGFRAALRGRLLRLVGAGALPGWLAELDRRLAVTPASGSASDPPAAAANEAHPVLIRALRQAGLTRVAELIAPGAGPDPGTPAARPGVGIRSTDAYDGRDAAVATVTDIRHHGDPSGAGGDGHDAAGEATRSNEHERRDDP